MVLGIDWPRIISLGFDLNQLKISFLKKKNILRAFDF